MMAKRKSTGAVVGLLFLATLTLTWVPISGQGNGSGSLGHDPRRLGPGS